jgi:twitching motility protein PilI
VSAAPEGTAARPPVSLRTLQRAPFDLLRELERRSLAAAAGFGAAAGAVEEWVGVGFRVGDEQFVMARDDIREVLMVPPAVTRVPGAKPWLKGLANVRGHLLPLADLREFLGAGAAFGARSARVLVASPSEFPVGLIVDEVYGFRRFLDRERGDDVPAVRVRCERFLAGSFRRAADCWPVFSLGRLLEDHDFQRAAAS